MKKYIIVILIFIVSNIIAVLAQNDDIFINALRNCTPYNSSDEIDINGTKATSKKQMQGWHGDKCTFKETVKLNGMNFVTTCQFSKNQIQEIVSASDNYFSTLKYSNKQIDISSPDAVKDNPVVQILNKYLQDPSVCTIEAQ